MKILLMFFVLCLVFISSVAFGQDANVGYVEKAIEMFPWLQTVLMYGGGVLILGWLSDIIINDKYDKGWFKKYFLKYVLALPVFKFILQLSFKIPLIGIVLELLFKILSKFSPENTE